MSAIARLPLQRQGPDGHHHARTEGRLVAAGYAELRNALQPFLRENTDFGMREIVAQAKMRTDRKCEVLAVLADENLSRSAHIDLAMSFARLDFDPSLTNGVTRLRSVLSRSDAGFSQ